MERQRRPRLDCLLRSDSLTDDPRSRGNALHVRRRRDFQISFARRWRDDNYSTSPGPLRGLFFYEGLPMSLYFPSTDECSRHTIFPGVEILTCAAEKMM